MSGEVNMFSTPGKFWGVAVQANMGGAGGGRQSRDIFRGGPVKTRTNWPRYGPRRSIGIPTSSQQVKGWAFKVSRGQAVGLQLHSARASRGRPARPQGVKG